MKMQVDGRHFEYVIGGPADAPVIVLIRGLGTQLIHWPERLLAGLHARGFRTVIFDNRDCGLSSKTAGEIDLDEVIAAVRAGRAPDVPYTLFDMADDVRGLLDGLGVSCAHIVGLSMGGRIAQIFASVHGPRTQSLCTIMSTTGNPKLSKPAPHILDAALRAPRDKTRGAIVAHALDTERLWAGSRYAYSDAELTALAGAAFDRCYTPAGVALQAAAILATGDQSRLAAQIATPALVIHGADDPLVPPDSGIDCAACIPGARLHIVEGLGHALPPSAANLFADLIAGHAEAAQAAA
jgi:pimeloyl-ACP methyl ester carboxylesterase